MTRISSAVLLALLLSGCGSEIRTDASALAAATTTAAGATLIADSLPQAEPLLAENVAASTAALPAVVATTVLYSEHDAEVTARRRGVVRVIGAELGDQVRTGQELARLEDDEEQAAVAVATAARDLTRLEYDRAAQLAENGMATRAELETATYRLRAAESELREAEIRLAYTRVTTPFAGAITRRFVRVGQLVEMGEPLFRTTALSPLRALLRIPEIEAHWLAPGQSVTFQGVGGQEATGRILRVAPAVDPVSGTVEVLVDVPDPRGMRPGSAVRASLERRAALER